MRSSTLIGLAMLGVCSSPSFADEHNAEFFILEAARVTPQKIARAGAPRLAGVARPGIVRGGNSTMASWYGGGEKLARHTASGEVFRPNGLTAAHRSLPLGTRIIVSANGRSVVVRVNDRGPAAWTGRSLDLSKGAAGALGMIGKGTARVTWRVA